MPSNLVPPHTVGAERAVRGGRQLSLTLQVGAERVPAALLLPLEPRPAPAALLLHGYTSRKEQMLGSIGHALLDRGIASLGVDLPLHGEREQGLDEASLRNPLALARQWRMALAECAAALALLGSYPEIDGARLAVVGYSLGAFLGVIAASREPSVRAVALAAGGDLPTNTPFTAVARTLADPVRAARKLAGRPLLMINGRGDRTVRPDQAERLFAAAAEPKTLRWYQGGHWLPPGEIEWAADWVARTGLAPRG